MALLLRRGNPVNDKKIKKTVRFEGLPDELKDNTTEPGSEDVSQKKSLEIVKGVVEGFKGIKHIKDDETRKRSKDANERKQNLEKKIEASKAVVALVETLEAGLSRCLAMYRSEAEDLLQDHMEKLQDIELKHQLSYANVVAENALLRERLGIIPAEQLQNILFQTLPIPSDKDRKAHIQRIHTEGDDKTAFHPRSHDDKLLNTRKHGGKNQAAGGSWQPFIAWVPNGAALAHPQPWKPCQLPETTTTPQAIERRMSRIVKNKDESFGILPGAVPSTSGNAESDSENSSNVEDKEKYEALEVWRPSDKLRKKMKARGSFADTESSTWIRHENDDCGHEWKKPFWVVNPDSNKRIAWDLTSLFMVIYDMILIPLFVFDLPENTFLSFMDWTTRLFWNADIVWSCCTGIMQADGRIEFRPRAIFQRYARTWMCMDLFIVVTDWISTILSSGGLGISKLARVFRIIRVVRLLRLVRMQEIIANIVERIQSDKVMFVLQVVQYGILLTFISHFFGCGWWGVGRIMASAGNSWVKASGLEEGTILSQYLVSLHWALVQFSGGFEEFPPGSSLERCYAVLIFVLCFIIGLVMCSSLTSSLTQQYIIGGTGARQMATLKKYLKQNNVPKNLSKRLCRNANHSISGDLTPDAVDLLNVISEPLKVEMHYEIYSNVLACHPFLGDLLALRNPVMHSICHRAMSMILLANSDVVFRFGEEPAEPKMYIVVSGTLDYSDMYGEAVEVTERQYLAEQCLWTTWRHKGNFTATSDVKMALLDALTFQDIGKRSMRKDAASALLFLQYASDFVVELNKTPNHSDLPNS